MSALRAFRAVAQAAAPRLTVEVPAAQARFSR